MRPIRPTELSPGARGQLLKLLLEQGVPKRAAGRAIDRLGWIATAPDADLFKGLARDLPDDPSQSDREFLTDVDRVIRSLRWRAEGDIEWDAARHSHEWYREKLAPILEELRADILLSIASWADQEARIAEYHATARQEGAKKKPRKIMMLAEAVAQVWIDELGLEPRRSEAFRTFLSIATAPARDTAGLGPVTDRQLDRLVPRLRAKYNLRSASGRPKKTPPK